MNFPTYPVGTLVQIISAAEFDALPKMMLAVRCFSIPFLMVTQILYPLNAVLFVAASCKLLVNLTLLAFTS